MAHCAPIRARSPTVAPAPITASAPTIADAAIRAPAPTTALGCTPGAGASAGWRSVATFANVAYGLGETSFGSAVCAAASGSTMTAAARVVPSWLRYFGFARNAIVPGPPDSRVATRRTSTAPSPERVAPVRAASSDRSMERPAGDGAGAYLSASALITLSVMSIFGLA